MNINETKYCSKIMEKQSPQNTYTLEQGGGGGGGAY